jgi:alkane 1-monooxygenase
MPVRYYLPLAALAAVPPSYYLGAIWYMPLALLVLFTTMDALLGVERLARSAAVAPIVHRLVPWLYIPAQLAALLWGASVARETRSIVDLLGLAVALGLLAGIFGMLAAHEMIHSPRRWERLLGLSMLASVGYPHFSISHMIGHHRHAGTVGDPATARRDESAYRFLLRSISGQAAEAWRFECRRAHRYGGTLLGNRVLRYSAIALAIDGGIALAFGPLALLFQIITSAMAILVLELFNYVAHYGLARSNQSDGTLERFGPQHSWNAPQRFNNWALLNGGWHSDHHARSAAFYQHLHPVAAEPELPMGYAGSILLALVPPLWRRVMNPRIERLAATPLA